MRIMVIDDEAQARRMLQIFLQRLGYEVLEAEDGATGLRLLREQPVDLIITDILMPNKEGLETITEIREHNREVKIIAMSGGGRMGNTDYLDLAKRFGADAIFAKPLDLNDLEAAITNLLTGEA